jgi:hypothetical protein
MTKETKYALRLAAKKIAMEIDKVATGKWIKENCPTPMKIKDVPNPCLLPREIEVEKVEELLLNLPAEELKKILESSANLAYWTGRLLGQAIEGGRD